MSNSVSAHDAALHLFNLVAWSEGKSLNMGEDIGAAPSRHWILRTYAQCLRVSLEPHSVEKVISGLPVVLDPPRPIAPKLVQDRR